MVPVTLVIVRNYHGYTEYGVSHSVAWNTAQKMARECIAAMFPDARGVMTWHKGRTTLNVRPQDIYQATRYPRVWFGGVHTETHASDFRHDKRNVWVFAVADDGSFREATDEDIANHA